MSNNRCAPGGGTPNGATYAPGSLEGTDVRALNPDPHAVPNQFIVDALNNATRLLPAGHFLQITPNGGRAARGSTHNHPAGDAADFQIVTPDGQILRPGDAPQLYETVIAGLTGDSLLNNRVAGIGLYSWGVHFDQSGHRQTGSGGVTTWNGWGSNPSPGPASVLQNGIAQGRARAANNQLTTTESVSDGSGGTEADPAAFGIGFGEGLVDPQLAAAAELAKQQQSACNTPAGQASTGGCSPVSGLGIGAAASLLGGFGLALTLPGPLGAAVSSFQSIPIVSQAAGIINKVNSITAPALGLLENPLSQLSPAIGNLAIGAGGDSVFNALSGKLPSPVANFIGNQNILSSVINDAASQVFDGDLGRLSSIINTVSGAAGTAIGVSQSLGQLQNQLFGNTPDIIANVFGGTNIFESVAGMSIDTLPGGLIESLVGNQTQVLNRLIGDSIKPMAAFGSMYTDLNSMITQGLGSVTGNINLLGADLQSLGKLANMKDLLRIGTPGQIIEQLTKAGANAVSDVIAGEITSRTATQSSSVQNSLNLSNINSIEFDDVAQEILRSVTDRNLIDDAFKKLNIKRSADGVNSLADLTNSDFLFPLSKDQNKFKNLNDISLHLAVCGAQGFNDLEQFGNLLSSMESMATEESFSDLVSPISVEEIEILKSSLAPTSEYSGDNDLTVADFIGTAAGYRHNETLPRMEQLISELMADPITDNYQSLVTLLEQTINGDFTTSGEVEAITIPDTAGYTFGEYLNLDTAVSAVVAAITEELDSIFESATSETAIKVKRLQSLHDETAHQLFKEHKLRESYGIFLGKSSEETEIFGGDGTTVEFEIQNVNVIPNPSSIHVFVNGVKLPKRRVSYNQQSNSVILSSAPSAGAEVEVNYDNGKEPITGRTSDILNFTSNLENFGTRTGFGKEADYIGRIISNDKHGARIKATMIQARNRERAANAGMECPGFNRTLSSFYDENINGITNLTDLTGIWSSDPSRAAEIYLQNLNDVVDRKDYFAQQLKANRAAHQPIFDSIMSKVNRQLLFFVNGNIAITKLATELYSDFKDTFRIMQSDLDNQSFVINYNQPTTQEGFVLGPYKEIVNEILKVEGLKTLDFDTSLSDNTKIYLDSLGIDMQDLVGVIQKTMLVNASTYLGLDATDVRNIFGMPSVSKAVLRNIANAV